MALRVVLGLFGGLFCCLGLFGGFSGVGVRLSSVLGVVWTRVVGVGLSFWGVFGGLFY